MKTLILTLLTLLTLLFITITVYGANYYSGVKFKNTPSNGDIVVWSDAGNQFEFSSLDAGDTYTNFSTSADDDTINELMAALDVALGVRALESVVGTSLNADDLVNTGGVLELQPEIPHTDAAQTWTGTQTLPNQTFTILTSVPGAPVTDIMYCFDNDTADPCNVPGLDDYCARYDGADWVAMFKLNGVKFFQSMPVPTLISTELDDTSTAYDLTEDEIKGTILSNSVEAGQWEFPAVAEGWNFIFIIEAANNVALHPVDSTKWYLNGTQLAADRSISNTAPTAGESIACFSTGTYVYCESKYVDFVSAAE